MKKLSVFISLLFLYVQSFSQTLPSGFFSSNISSGSTWSAPVGATFTPDGQRLFVWEKGGRVYVCNRDASGNYVKQSTPVINISDEVGDWRDFGLIGFALDPAFASNGNIYLLYVVDRHHLMTGGLAANGYNAATNEYFNATIGRVTRYTTTTTGGNLASVASTRKILLGESKSTGIPILHESHGVGGLVFAADGTLLITCGDGASYNVADGGSISHTYYAQALTDGIIRTQENVGAFRSQMLNSHNGKLLRISPVTGDGIVSNPFYDASVPRSAKSRVWAFGFRNPFRVSAKPGTGSTNPLTGDIGEIFVGDVGWNTWEELNTVKAPGTNFGWPLYEGHTALSSYVAFETQNGDEPNTFGTCSGRPNYRFKDLLRQDNAAGDKSVFNPCNASQLIGTHNRYIHARPSIDWQHGQDVARVGKFNASGVATNPTIGTAESGVVGTPFRGNCSAGGAWYSGTNGIFPAQYKNTFIAADYGGNWIRRLTMDFTDVVTRVDNFASSAGAVVCIAENPLDGTLVTVDIGSNTVKKITYGGNQPPVAKLSANVKFGSSPLSVNFTGNTSFDPSPGGSIASYSWNFGGGSPATSTAQNPTNIVFTDATGNPKKFVVKLTVTDNGGATHTDSLIISVNNTPPTVNITSPVKNSTYIIGGDVVYPCTATVTDAQHSGSQLKYEWQTILRHNNHEHPEAIDNNVNTSTTISRIGCNGDSYYWMVKLTVTDAAGLATTDSSKIFPNCGGDLTPPTVTNVSPTNNATGVPVSTAVSAIFNEAMDASTINNSTIELRNPSNALITAVVSYNAGTNTATLTPSAALANSTVYSAKVKSGVPGVKDVAGNALASDYNWSFTTVAAADNTPPTVSSVVPLNGATGVSTVATVSAVFNEAMNASSINGSTIELRGPSNVLITATVSYNAATNTATLTTSAALANSTLYTARVISGASGVKDVAGNALASDYSWSFTTIAAADNTPPTVSSVVPLNGATGVSTVATVSAVFNEAMNASSINGSTIELRGPSNVLITATVSYNAATNTATLTPSAALANSTLYTARVISGASGVKDVAGNALASDYSWSFTTGTVAAQPPVTIQSFTTKTGIAATAHPLTGVPAGALLVLATTADAVVSDCSVSSSPSLTWTKRSDAGASQSDNAEIWTAVYAAGGSITVTSNWGGDNSQASVCYIVLNAEPALGGASAIATLQAAPSVTITTTRDNSIIFGCTADWKAINGATRTLRDAATERLYFKDGNYTTYYYTKAAAAIAAYTEGVSLPTGQQASTALLEIRGAVSVADIIPPTVTSVAPVNGSTGVSVSTAVSGIFNEAMDATTINGSTVELRNSSNTLITATVSYNAATRTVTLTPSAALTNSIVYTAKIISGASGVKDLAGNPLASDYNWSFTTEAGDITPPTISSVSPVNGATDVSVNTTASAVFSEAMNASTINSSTIELRNASNVLITAAVSYNAGTRTATVTPSAALANSTVYTAKVISGSSGVKDIAGNALASDYGWSFTTLAADNIPPTVSSVTPVNGATDVSVSTTASAIFSEAMNASTINGSTIELRNPSNALITATVSYNAATRTVTLTPSAALANSTVYTAKIISGSSGVKDAAGNALASDYGWSFTTGTAVAQPPVTIQSFTTKTGIAATTHSLTGVPAGALLVLATTADAILSNCSVSSSPSLTWTKRADAGATQSDNAEIWTAVYTAGGSITVTSNWGGDNSQASVCYVVLNAEPVLGGASAIATLQTAPSVTITTTRENSIIFGCTADWKAINGATRTLRDAATERLYFKDGNYTTYYYTKAAAAIAAYTEGVSLPTGQQASTALLEIRSAGTVLARPAANSALPVTSSNVFSNSLGQNYPNPFDKITIIPFTISATEKVSLVLFDINGRIVKVLVNGSKDKGTHAVNFNAGSLAKGIYYYRIRAGNFTEVKKLIIW